MKLGRNSVGYELDLELLEIVKKKLGLKERTLFEGNREIEIIIREDARYLRTHLQERINEQKSVTQNGKRSSKKASK